MTCKPKTVPKVIRPPEETVECFNCGCQVKPGKCHCGAEVYWAFDPYDGWYPTGSIASVVFES